METLQTYIKVCQAIRPVFTKEAAEMLKKEYCDLRQNALNKFNSNS